MDHELSQMQQLLRETRQNFLLDTSLRKIQTDFKNINFISVDDIDHNTKKANIEAYNFFKNEKLPDICRSVLNRLYGELYNRPVIDIQDPSFIYPISIFENYQSQLLQLTNDSLLYFAEKHFLNWYKAVSNKSRYLYLVKGDKKALKKLFHRFTEAYAKKINKRMNWLMYRYGNESAVSVTLTLNPSNFRSDKMCMWETITPLLNEFLTELKRYLRSLGHKNIKYIRCIEAMKGQEVNDFVGRGNPHIHLCFFGLRYIDKKMIDRFWAYGHTFVNSTAKGQKVRYPIHYVAKYITKTYNINDPDNTLNQSLVWFFNKNSFDHSRGLVLPLYVKGSGEWSCLYLVELDPQDNEFIERDLIFDCEYNLFRDPPPRYQCFKCGSFLNPDLIESFDYVGSGEFFGSCPSCKQDSYFEPRPDLKSLGGDGC